MRKERAVAIIYKVHDGTEGRFRYDGTAMKKSIRAVATLIAAGSATIAIGSAAPLAHADPGVCLGCWEAAANSPSKELMDWGIGGSVNVAVSGVLAQCARREQANDCQLLAVGTCVGIAWDADQPINHAHGAAADSKQAAIAAAVATAGPHANGAEGHCSWERHS
jgi:hypothetical protein